MLHATSTSGDTDAECVCPECMARFAPRKAHQLFCCDAHRIAWHNRDTVRGRRLTPLAITARVTRNGTRPNSPGFSMRAARDADCLIREWRRDDRAAGRMSYEEYVDRRYRAGVETL